MISGEQKPPHITAWPNEENRAGWGRTLTFAGEEFTPHWAYTPALIANHAKGVIHSWELEETERFLLWRLSHGVEDLPEKTINRIRNVGKRTYQNGIEIVRADVVRYQDEFVLHPFGEIWVRLTAKRHTSIPVFPVPSRYLYTGLSSKKIYDGVEADEVIEDASVYPGWKDDLKAARGGSF